MANFLRKLTALALVITLAACSGPGWVSLSEIPTSSAAPSASATVLPPVPTPASVQTASPAAAAPAHPAPTASSPAQYLVLISLDGCKPEYLGMANMPNLAGLIQAGTSFAHPWVGALENVTPSAHTLMSTGSFPRRNGIPGYSWGDPQTGEKINPTTEDAVLRGDMAAIVERSGVPTLAGLVKARYPDGPVSVAAADKFYAAQALGMGPADTILYMKNQDGSISLQAVNGRDASGGLLKDPSLLKLLLKAPNDNVRALLLARRLAAARPPRALMIQLQETDTIGHATGGTDRDAIRQALETTDQALGELITDYRQAGIFDQTLWVITSDHGMTAKGDVVIPAEVFQAAGYRKAGNDELGLPETRLANHAQAATLAEKIAALRTPGITGVYARVKDGDRYTYQPAPDSLSSLPPALNDTYLYLLDTFAGPYSPDIVAMTSGNTAFDKKRPSPGGSHNMINWADQGNVMILSGPGVAAGNVSQSPARLVDLLPTIARLMDLPRGAWDGTVLADALQNPSPQELDAQKVLNEKLAPMRDALEATR